MNGFFDCPEGTWIARLDMGGRERNQKYRQRRRVNAQCDHRLALTESASAIRSSLLGGRDETSCSSDPPKVIRHQGRWTERGGRCFLRMVIPSADCIIRRDDQVAASAQVCVCAKVRPMRALLVDKQGLHFFFNDTATTEIYTSLFVGTANQYILNRPEESTVAADDLSTDYV